MELGTVWQIEGLNPEGEWKLVAGPLGREGDHRSHRDSVVRTLRQHGIGRYSHIRLAKYVTTLEVVGEEIKV